MEYRFDKDKIKQELTIEQVMNLVAELGGEPRMAADREHFVSRTICHGGYHHKLYYYNNTHLFRCFTECSPEIFDIYELVRKVKSQEQNKEWTLTQAIQYIATYFNIATEEFNFENLPDRLQDWQIIEKYNKINSLESQQKQRVEMKFYSEEILKYLPHPHIIPWEEEGITYEVMRNRGICFNPSSQGIVIPHYDIEGHLIGVRERTLIKEEEQYGKYKPAILNGQMYNHPLGFALYNLNFSKENIKIIKKAIIMEGEKSCLKYASYFGMENDISVAVCGSALINYQVQLLLSLGVQEIVIAFDKDFDEIGDEVWKRQTEKYYNIHNKYSKLCTISFIFDKYKLLGKKCSPIDCGKDTFLKLFEERIIL